MSGTSNTGNTGNNDNNLVAVSSNLLFEGMQINEDIYDADATLLIVKRGSTLNAETIERIRSVNAGRETIHVSGNTYRALIERREVIEPVKLREIEEATGYVTAKDETYKMLDVLARDQVIQQEALHSVSVELSNQLHVTSPSTILSLINALAPVDEYLQRHCVDVGMLNGLFGRWFNMPKADVDKLVLIGLLHDCGKALVPPQVLNAPRKLTVAEFEVIKMHTVYSYQLLSGFPEPVRLASRGHHEKVGGAGYPDRLPHENITFEARITAVSDIYDAMVSQRAYKRPRSPFSIMAVLNELSGKELDAGLVNVFNTNMPKELMNKQVMMSDGVVAVVRTFYPEDIEYPSVEVNGSIIKTSKNWYCTSMHTES